MPAKAFGTRIFQIPKSGVLKAFTISRPDLDLSAIDSGRGKNGAAENEDEEFVLGSKK